MGEEAAYYCTRRAKTLTQTPCLRPAPQTVGATLPDVRPHQCVTMVTHEDGRCAEGGQGAQLGSEGGRGQLPAGDDWTMK
jgi:hypothetical protein